MSYVDGPLEEVLKIPTSDSESLLRARAWEVKESPEDLGYKLAEDWPKLPADWSFGQVVGVRWIMILTTMFITGVKMHLLSLSSIEREMYSGPGVAGFMGAPTW